MIAGLLAIVFLCVVELGLALFVVKDNSYPNVEHIHSIHDPIDDIQD